MGKKKEMQGRYIDLECVVTDARCRLVVLNDVIQDMGMNDARDEEQADRLIGVSHMLNDVVKMLDEATQAQAI